MDSDPWEALDLDDSDLPSLLRPCKQRRSTATPAAAENQAIPSQPPLQKHPEQLHQPLPPSPSHRVTIPGPAGAVHAAMLRKDLDRQNRRFSSHQTGNDGVLSTQDFIRKALDDTAEFDYDFSRHPWLSALQFMGAQDGLIPSTQIRSIKTCLKGNKVDQVVAVVKSCTRNHLGGLLVSLKDPTGTIGASIHHKVISQSEFGKEITTGAVLILQEVAMFVPVKSAHYLNVTLKNLVKVFCQSKGSTSKLYENRDSNEEPMFVNSSRNRGTKGTDNTVETTREKPRATNEIEIQRQPLMSKTTLPEWTDQQLDELFGDEHDGSLLE